MTHWMVELALGLLLIWIASDLVSIRRAFLSTGLQVAAFLAVTAVGL